MEEQFLYRQIAETIRQEIIKGVYKPGDRLPTVRKMTANWDCTPGTVHRAYQELVREGLVVSRPGQGTRISSELPAMQTQPLRRAALVHHAEAFLLEALTNGYSTEEAEQSLHIAMDRWRATSQAQFFIPPKSIRFAGSHDLAVDWLAANFTLFAPEYTLHLVFSGSLGGLIALAEGKAELAGCHLWDYETDTYNTPFIQRLLPGRKVAMVTLAHRRQGLIVPPGNPLNLQDLPDLIRPGVHFINRQPGSGTRVWLDARLHMDSIDPRTINGYTQECPTHSDVARAIAEHRANAGLGLEATALAFGLGFIFLHREPFQFAIPAENMELPAVKSLVEWLQRPIARSSIASLGGYDTTHTGEIQIFEPG